MLLTFDFADNAPRLRRSVIAPGSDGDACPPETINGGGHGVNGDVAVPRPVGAVDGGGGGELQSTETVITRLTYFFGGQAVAVRVVGDSEYPANNGLFYLHTEDPSRSLPRTRSSAVGLGTSLGSTSGLTYGLDESGQPHPAAGATSTLLSASVVPGSAGLFLPYGEYRQRLTTYPDVTDTGACPFGLWAIRAKPERSRRVTGHRHNDDIGLVTMNARFYVAGVGRFASADPNLSVRLIPEPGAAIGYNRYAYANLNPVAYVDPSGHCVEASSGASREANLAGDDGGCWEIYYRWLDAGYTGLDPAWEYQRDDISIIEQLYLQHGIQFRQAWSHTWAWGDQQSETDDIGLQCAGPSCLASYQLLTLRSGNLYLSLTMSGDTAFKFKVGTNVRGGDGRPRLIYDYWIGTDRDHIIRDAFAGFKQDFRSLQNARANRNTAWTVAALALPSSVHGFVAKRALHSGLQLLANVVGPIGGQALVNSAITDYDQSYRNLQNALNTQNSILLQIPRFR